MTRVLAVHGVGLDRAWPELGHEHGELMRGWSAELLAEAVQAAAREEVDALVVAGDLFDRATATPSTVEYAAAVLGSAGVPVVVVPGQRDWYGDGSPYVHSSWPASVRIAANAAFEPVLDDRIWVSAWTGPTSQLPATPAGSEGPALLVRPSVAGATEVAERLPHGLHLLTSGEQHDDEGWTSVAPLASLERAMGVLLVDVAEDHRPGAARVPLGEPPVLLVELDVTGLGSEEQLREALVAAADRPALIRLMGELAVEVLPPALHAEPLPPHLVVDETELTFADPRITPDDRTTRAELLRGLAGLGLERRRLHVSTALGLRALAEVEG